VGHLAKFVAYTMHIMAVYLAWW